MGFEYLTPEEAAELTPEEAEWEEAALKRESRTRGDDEAARGDEGARRTERSAADTAYRTRAWS
jgi:hypothetical protein